MLRTGCNGCIFLKNNGHHPPGCMLNEVCVRDKQNSNIIFAPGLCRSARSTKWANEQGTTKISDLRDKMIEERKLEMDLVVFFNEAEQTTLDLELTLDSRWYQPYTKQIIIADTTGTKNTSRSAKKRYANTFPQQIKTVLDVSIEPESITDRGETIKRLADKIGSPFFLAIPAGYIINNFDNFAKMIQMVPSRVIHWYFPFVMGSTAIVPEQLNYGLFHTKSYRSIMRLTSTSDDEKTFTQRLRIKERMTQFGLTWFCHDCWLSNNRPIGENDEG